MAVTFLLAGAKPDNLSSNSCDKNNYSGGETALYKAVSIYNVGIVSLLLDHAADVEAKNRSSETALYCAVGAGPSGQDGQTRQAAILKMLLKRGASMDCQTATGDTPIRRVLRIGSQRATSIMKDFAKKSGRDFTPIANTPQEMVTMKEICLRHLGIIEESDLANVAEFRDTIVRSLDEGHGPSLDVPRRHMFEDIRDCGERVRLTRSAM